jgi:hypothetical protein
VRFTALLLAVLATAAAADGPQVVDVERATVTTKGGARLELDGGVWLSDAYAVGYAKELADKRARVEHLEATAGKLDPVVLAIIAAATTTVFGAGVYVGVQLAR